jgi:SAM-dependent methyltransferase
MLITKEEFYKARGETYALDDEEALIRYQNAVRWMTLREGLVVREVGCKFAVIRDLLDTRAQGADYKAIDIDQATLNRIPRFNAAQFICHDARAGLPFPDSSADYILCLEVMEHLERPTDFINEVRRVLKVGGRLILSVPNPYCWMEWLANSRREMDIEGHISTFTYQNVDALLRFAGLRLLDMQGTFTRVPFSRRARGRYSLVRTSALLLSRSFMFLVEKP